MDVKVVHWAAVNKLPEPYKRIFVEEYIAQAAKEIDPLFANLILMGLGVTGQHKRL
jgi:hypothetical protein